MYRNPLDLINAVDSTVKRFMRLGDFCKKIATNREYFLLFLGRFSRKFNRSISNYKKTRNISDVKESKKFIFMLNIYSSKAKASKLHLYTPVIEIKRSENRISYFQRVSLEKSPRFKKSFGLNRALNRRCEGLRMVNVHFKQIKNVLKDKSGQWTDLPYLLFL